MGLIVVIVLFVLGFPICASIALLRKVSRLERKTRELEDRLRMMEEQRGHGEQAAFTGAAEPMRAQPETPPVFEARQAGQATEPPDAEPVAVEAPPQAWEEAPPVVAPLHSPPEGPVSAGAANAERPEAPGYPNARKRGIKFALPTDVEKFMGVKLFAWLGGLALFLAIAFFIKYSFENNLIPPQIRVVLGFIAGVVLITGGLRLPLSKSPVTVQTLCATGVVVLYADFFASHALYHLIQSNVLTFLLMILVTATAFLLAVRLDAQVVAILGLVGGFLTPFLLSTGVDNPPALFGYLAILDVGLIAVALYRRWEHLTLLAAAATVFMQICWVDRFFVTDKILTAQAIFLGFTILFTLALGMAQRLKAAGKWTEAAGLLMPFASLVFVFYLLTKPYPDLAVRPGLIFSFVFLVDLALLGQAWLSERLRLVQWASGGAVFVLLAIWTVGFLTIDLLNRALALYLVFAVLHAVFPVVLQRLRPATSPTWWANLFPFLSLLLIMQFISRHSGVLPIVVWPCALVIDFIAFGLAMATGTILATIPMLVLTVSAIALWIDKIPSGAAGLPTILGIIGCFSLVFFIVGIVASLRNQAKPADMDRSGRSSGAFMRLLDLVTAPSIARVLTPALSATLPFLLLMILILHLPLPNPSPVFGLGALLIVLLLGLTRFHGVDLLAAVGLGCVLMIEHLWHYEQFDAAQPVLPLLWYMGFAALFLGFPFVFSDRFKGRIIPWATSALSAPLHFGLIYRVITQAYPNPYMGLVPGLMALPCLAGLVWLIRRADADDSMRNALLALFGGATLFFITMVFPVQFERQWITIGWALEGAALLWLFHRVPHPGLKLAGAGLLSCAFVRLALNPAVFSYHPRTGAPIFNWYLYAYGITVACLMAGGRLLAPPHHKVLDVNAGPKLYGLGTVLAFFLLNIEIADYYSTGVTLTFNLSGNLAQDMTYSLAWAVFAFVLFIVGVYRGVGAARYAGFGLLTATMIKLFLHDLWRLGGLYRIGSLIGLAMVLILVSFVYQRVLVNKPAGADDSQRK